MFGLEKKNEKSHQTSPAERPGRTRPFDVQTIVLLRIYINIYTSVIVWSSETFLSVLEVCTGNMKQDVYWHGNGFESNEYGYNYGNRTPPHSYIADVPFAPTPPSPPSLVLPPSSPLPPFSLSPSRPPSAYRPNDDEMAIRKRLREQEAQYHANQVKKRKPILPCYVCILLVLMAMAAIYFIVYGSIVTVRTKQSFRWYTHLYIMQSNIE